MLIDGFDFTQSVTSQINVILHTYFKGQPEVRGSRAWWSKIVGEIKGLDGPAGLITSMWYRGVTYEKSYCLTVIDGEVGYFYLIPRSVNVNTKKEREEKTHLKYFNACNNKTPIFAYLRLHEELAGRYGCGQKVASNVHFKLSPFRHDRLCKSHLVYRVEVDPPHLVDADLPEGDGQHPGFYLEERIRRAQNIEAKKFAHIHSIIINYLIEKLRKDYKNTEFDVLPEHSLFLGKKEYIGQADVVLKMRNSNEICKIFEVKTESTMSENIRAALGQLVSYSRIYQNREGGSLCVVSNVKSDAKGNRFLSHLNKLFGKYLHISYEVIDVK
ncbi:MAG: hypothetical protein Q8S96_16995 [Hydrogenophaga sp.]|uniref:hypothetical protein n=1 Tax=Hydrogenophaga sp. TaxID=1904254 RepID=UPI00271585C7|nr:hypothetical protein [Hydrogenophaga sp.]MDO9479961.1 hypothetical protein [Hydrogenophaga sp.]MDP3346138.1 hypothetical protein [Hydrogenophaga sp.]MDP3808936.1 hypothetical protein [Hydrogenophaga sp.]